MGHSDVRIPEGTATFLMGVVDAGAAVGHLDEWVAQVLARHGGVRPGSPEPDGSFVGVFPRALSALAAAIELQVLIEQRRDPRVRLGLHSGEARSRDDGSLVGPVLTRAAGLRDLGHGGQILLSGVTHQLVVDDLPDDVEVLSLGAHELRDLARPEQVWQVLHPQLPSRFPDLRTVTRVAVRLPTMLTSFVGREGEVAEITELLSQARLLTVTGAGGCGKTRLAVEVARRTAGRHPDGIWFADLAPIASSDRVAAAVATALGLPVDNDPLGAVVERLRSQEMLLVLDNCEHVVDTASALVAEILQRCARVVVLVTSREPLGVDGERTWRVPSMSIHDEVDGASMELGACDAVQLFADRAKLARADFAISPESVRTVAAICRRLDGIPLAIELAAARVRVLPLARIAAGLDDRFKLLGGGSRAALSRHRTLEASVGWSHNLLTTPERVVLRRLSVFAGGFTLEGAEAVAGFAPIEPFEVLEVIGRLVDRSLVVMDATDGRYGLQETIRQFAADRLVEASEAAEARDRHAAFVEDFLRRARQPIVSGDAGWSARASQEIHNLRAAIAWVMAGDDVERKFRLLELLSPRRYIWVPGWPPSEARHWAQLALADPETHSVAAPLRAWVLGDLATSALFDDGDLVTARRAGDEALELVRGLADQSILPDLLVVLGTVAMQEGDWLRSKACLTEAIALGETDLSRRVPPGALTLLAGLAIVDSDFTTGRVMAAQALAAAELAGVAAEGGQAVALLGAFDLFQGRLAQAQHAGRRCVDVGREIQNGWLEAIGLLLTGVAASRSGCHEEARAATARSREVMLQAGLEVQEPLALAAEAEVAFAAGDVDDGRRLAEASATAARGEVGTTVTALVGWHVIPLARIALFQGDLDAAVAVMDDLGPRVPDRYFQALMTRYRGRVASARGDGDAAEAAAHAALATLAEVGAQLDVADLLDDIAGHATENERWIEAARLFAAAQGLREASGAVLPIPDQASHEQAVNALRDQFDDDEFDAAWAEGFAMTLDESVSYAARGRGARKRPSVGWESLTPSELRVAGLVAQGANNQEIAQRLLITRNTVKTHLSHVFTKLGVTSRSALAAEAVRNGLGSGPDAIS